MDATDLIADEPGHRDDPSLPVGDAPEPVAAKFARLKAEWEKRTQFLSNPNTIIGDPAYQEIIGMGLAVVPLLLTDLRRGRYFWYAALEAITGEDPIPDGVSGDMQRIADAWSDWGRSRGY